MAKNSSQASAFSRLATRSAAKLRRFACDTCPPSSSTLFTSKFEMEKHEKMFHPGIFANKRMREERRRKTERKREMAKKRTEGRKNGRKAADLIEGRMEKKAVKKAAMLA